MPQTKNITIRFGSKAEKQLRKLPSVIIKKLEKQLDFLAQDINYPSLHVKKMQGSKYFEARIDYHYRFIFSIKENEIVIIALGPHDEGLGKN